MFKVGDKVFDIQYGWGRVVEIDVKEEFPIGVDFIESVGSYTSDGKYYLSDNYPTLSFTEYDYVNGGFSQERLKVGKKDIGKLVKIKSENDFDGFIGVLTSICEAGLYEVNGYRFINVELYEEN